MLESNVTDFRKLSYFSRPGHTPNWTRPFLLAVRTVPEAQGDDTLKFWTCKMWWIFGGKFSVNLPRKNKLNNFVAKNFTTFFTAKKKEICHLNSLWERPLLTFLTSREEQTRLFLNHAFS